MTQPSGKRRATTPATLFVLAWGAGFAVALTAALVATGAAIDGV